MRALIHSTFGDPTEVLEVAERPLPEPGEREVRVRTVLVTIHNHDLWTIRGTYGFKPDLPAASGTEARSGPKKRPMKMLGTPQSRTNASPRGRISGYFDKGHI